MRKTPLALLAAALVVSVTAVGTSAAPPGRFRPAVTIGADGNEPLIRSAPDGTLYVSALQHLYVSRDAGRHWTQSAGSPYSTTLNQNSDSSIQVDAKGRLYMTFDWPYAGATAVCTSDDHATTMSCDPSAIPGGTDRMWIAVASPTTSYLVTNEGLYQTVFSVSTDVANSYAPRQTTAATVADPTDGPLLVSPTTGAVVQPIIDNLTNQTATDNFESGTGVLRVFDPSATGTPANVSKYPIPLTAGGALPGAAYGKDGTLYVTAEKAIRGNGGKIVGVGVQVARSRDDGKTWTVLPMIPGTAKGTSTFVALGAGKAGHVGLVFYRASVAGNPGTVPASTHWDAVYAESTDALSAHPHWTLTTVDEDAHVGVICATAGCLGSGRFAGDFLDTTFDAKDRPQIVWMRDTPGSATATQIRYTTTR
ncbi:MAG: hypothetical protein QOD07_2197 [Frankiaceae bacterium]|jgi:hypothetical protein|nr:hypothetical protein [Frankiaceae bacterium]